MDKIVLTDGDALADLHGRPRPDNPTVGDFTISAKPIEWIQQDARNWNENRYGFYIMHMLESDPWPYFAAWGEGEEDTFETLEEAQKWCQNTIDRWVRDAAVMTPNAQAEALPAGGRGRAQS
jgi:hypothetical protein